MDDLLRIKTLLAAGVPIPPDLARWLIRGIDVFCSGRCKTLCVALGLRRPGYSSHATREKLQCRNDGFKNIAKMYPGPPWQQAGTIASQLKKWPRLPDEEKALYGYLLSLKIKIPDIDGIYKILKKD